MKPEPSPPTPSGGLLTHVRFRRYLALALLALSALYSFASFGQVPSLQAIQDQLAIDKAQGLDCEYVPLRAQQGIVAALAIQSGADEPLLRHSAWEAQMQPQALSDCGLLQLVQATGPTTAQFNALQSQVTALQSSIATMQQQITAIQKQLASSPPPPPAPGPTSMALALDGSVHGNVGSGASLSVSLTTTNPNDIIYVVITTNLSTMGATPVQDTAALSWSQRQTANGGGNFLYVFTAKSSGTLSGDSITVTPSGTTFITVDAFGVSGENFSSPFDSNASLPGTSGTNTVTISTSNANDLIISAATLGAASSATPPAGFTSISNANFQWVGYEIVSATQSNLAIVTTQGAASIADAVVAASGSAATSYLPILGVG